jgi:hypothetical protein
MIRTAAFLIFALVSLPSQHWTQTADETIWRGRYTNCDKGWAVNLPHNVVAHGSLPPYPNHGFLVSADVPDTTAEVTLNGQRLVGIYDEYDAAGFGSARAYLESNVKHAGQVTIVEEHDSALQKLPAAYIRYRSKNAETTIENVELVAYRAHPKNSSPIFYVVWFRTPSQYYAQDRELYLELRDAFYLLPIPAGECSND